MMKKILSLFVLLMVVTIGARAGDVNATLDHTAGAQWGNNTGASTVDAEKEHYNNDAANSWAGCAYAKFTFSIPEGHSISKATLTYSVNQGGRSGRNDIIYYMSKEFDLDWANFAGQTGKDLRNAGSRAGKAVEAAATGGTGDRIGLSQDVTTAVKAIYEAGQSYIIFQWTGNAGGADLYGKASENAPTLVITTTNETLYEATFNANDGAISPTVTVYSDADRKTSIAKNALSANTTYYFTATLTGYQDYNGDFTVETSNPTVNFTMTAKNVFNYTVNGVDGSDNPLGQVNNGSGFEGDNITYYYPQYVLSGTTLFVKNKNGGNPYWGASGTLDANNKEFSVQYGDGTIENVVFYKEAEDIEGFTAKTTNNAPIRCSNGTGGVVAEETALTTLAPGKYKIYGQVWGTTGVTAGVKAGEKELWSLESTGSLVSSTSEEFEIAESTELKVYTTGGNDNRMLDLLYIVKTGEYVPVVSSYTVTISDEIENGTVVADPTSAKAGDVVTLTNTPAEGYEFVSYSVTCKTNNEAVIVTDGKFTMPADDVTVSATFAKVYAVTISNEIENGTVVADPTSAKAGDVVTLTNTPAEGYEFVSYSVTGKTIDEAVIVTDGKFTMPADDVTVSATFQLPTPPSYDITVADNIENGTVTVDPTTAKAGEEVTITATPAEGYELASISVTGQTSNLAVEVSVDGKFTMPADAVTVNAKFQQKAVDPSGDEEIALAADMFYTWDGYGADASKIASATVDFKLGESVAAGTTVVGTGSVEYLTYADMTGSTKVIFEGKDGTAIRLLMNRQESNNGPLVEKTATIAEGKAEISLTDLAYVHINAIKIPYNGSTGNIISAITFVKPNDPLAGPKEALKDAIAAAKMQNSVAKTEESFAALTKAISDGEAALADAQATAESLTTAKSDIETAVKGLTLAEGYAELTKEMFKQYASVDEPGEGTATNGAYELFTASDLPYGDGSVSELKWADLTKYDKLIVTVAGATAPRLCMNRLVKDGQQAATQEDSKMLDINPNNDYKWSTEKYQTVADGVYTIDLAAIVKDYSFARLHCIKKQGWGAGVVVTGMYLHEAPVTYDITVADNIENGTVTVDPTTAKAGDEVTITATPAEGYELASISVTGQTSNLAVEVTDGKFTMPADDVTVSAKFQKKVIYIETDLTAKFNSLATTQWTGSSGQVGWAAPKVKTNTGLEVAAWERYNGSCDWTGDIMSSSVTGLAPGTYKIELYGAAAFTFDRGFGSTAFTGDFSKDKSDTYKENESIDENTGVTLYAETAEGKVSKEIPIWYATNFNTSGIATATLENVIVGESGEIKIGLSKTSTSTNWHVVQLKGVTAQVPAADVLADAVEAAKSIAESDVPAKLYSEIQTAIETYDKEYATADEYQTAINALNSLVEKANGYSPLAAVLNEGESYKANVPAEDPAIAAYDAAIADVKGAYDDAVVADIPAAVKVVEAALPALAKAQTAPGSDLTTLVNNTSWTCPQGNGPGKYQEIYTETYNESAYQPGKVIYQKIEGLIPGGVYEVKFLAVANTAWGKSNFGDGLAQVYANEVTSDISVIEQNNCNPTEYEQTLTAEVGDDGVFEYGMQNVAAGGNWYVVKGVSMTLKEVIISYSVDIAEGIENGTVEVSAKKAAAGEEVTITATPAEGYELASITVTGVASEEIVEVTDGKFTMPADDVTVTATFVLATGIDAAPADKSIKADGKYFKNGKLIIIKNGKEYNAAGVAK